MYKFQIKQVNEREVIAEVSKGNKVLFTKEFPIDAGNLGFNLDMMKDELKKEVRLIEQREDEARKKKDKENEFKKLIGKKLDL